MRRMLSPASLALAIGLGSLSPAGASILTLAGSTLSISIGALPGVVLPQNVAAVPISVSSGTGGFSEPPGIFTTGIVAFPTSLFTGVPIIHQVFLGNLSNATKVVTANGGPGGGFGGLGTLAGTAFINFLAISNLAVPLSVIGKGGSTAGVAGALAIAITGTGWTTGAAVIDDVTVTTPNGAVVNTVTMTGSDARTRGHRGTLLLVSPFRVLINVAGNLPGFAVQRLTFVPEPALLLLLGAGCAGLAVLGWRRRPR